MKKFFSFSTTDPEYLETVMAPIVGRASVKPVKTARFNATVRVKQLHSLSVFTVRADSIKINIEPPHHYVGLYLPLGWPFIVTENTRKARFVHDIHLLKPDRPLALESKRGCQVLVAHLYAKPLQDYALKLNDSDKLLNPNVGNRIEMFNPTGLLLARRLANLWSVLRRFEYDPNLTEKLWKLRMY